jgi:hypothetical protein
MVRARGDEPALALPRSFTTCAASDETPDIIFSTIAKNAFQKVAAEHRRPGASAP